MNIDNNILRIILQFTLEGNFIKEWNSISKAGYTLNIRTGDICKVCSGKRNSAGGFKWKYKEN